MHVPAHFVHSIFPTYPQGYAYVADKRSPIASIVGIIRAGHSPEDKSQLVQTSWKAFQRCTGVSDRDLSVALQEVSPSQAIENGMIMPEQCLPSSRA